MQYKINVTSRNCCGKVLLITAIQEKIQLQLNSNKVSSKIINNCTVTKKQLGNNVTTTAATH